MDREQLKSTFDQQASSYDQQWSKLAAFREAQHILIASILGPLPSDARLLCVGAGTGAEILYLAQRFPGWSFAVVEPSPGMLEVCRRRAQEQGIAGRCSFHEGYLESLPASGPFDAATCLLVSQFILDKTARSLFFSSVAQRLRPGGVLVSSDLSSELNTNSYRSLQALWFRTMAAADVTPEGLERMRAAYARDVAVLSASEIESIIVSGGFDNPTLFFQAGLIRAWFALRASPAAAG